MIMKSGLLLLLVVVAFVYHFAEAQEEKKLKKKNKKLSTCIDTYPGFEGTLAPVGIVTVKYTKLQNTKFKMMGKFEGLEGNCNECGFHIHSGTSCDNHTAVGGHYWNDEVIEDRWFASFGAVYETSKKGGKGKGAFKIDNGYTMDENEGHAVVLHAKNGTRVACGVLAKGKTKFKECKN